MNRLAIENSCMTKYVYQVLNKTINQSINQHKCYVNLLSTPGWFVTLFIKCKIQSGENTALFDVQC